MKVLISTLGKGQFDKEKGKYDYKESIYLLPDGSEVKTKLVSKALLDFLKPDEVYVIGTHESLWELADELLDSYKKVLIPYGKSREEFWDMLKIVSSEIDVTGKEIYIDITHGFRAIPFMISSVINLFSKVKGAKVKGLYYGIFEAKDEQGRTPIVDLLPILEISEWIEAFVLFESYGDGDTLADLIENNLQRLSFDQRKKAGRLNSIPKLLRKYSQAVGFTAVDFIPKFVDQISSLIVSLEDLPVELSAVEILKEAFSKTRDELKQEDTEAWKNQFRVVKWLFNKRRYSQATIALEECIFTYVLESIGFDPLDDVRKKLGMVFKEDVEANKFFSEELNALFSKIQDLRNKTGHAFMKREVTESHIKGAVDKLSEYIEETWGVLSCEAKPIRDKEALIDYIKCLKGLKAEE